MGVQKSIEVKIKALVEGLAEVRAFVGELQKLSAAPAGGGAVAVRAGSVGEVQQVAAAVRELVQQVKELQPGKLQQLIQAGGNVGAFLSGVSRYREAIAQLQKAKADAGDAIARVTARAREFGSEVGQKVSGAVDGLTARLPALSGGLGGAGAGMAAAGGAGVAAATGIGLVAAGVLALVAAVTVLSAALPVAAGLLKSLFEVGVGGNSQLEQTRLGIAAVVASLAELRDASGTRLEGADAFNASLAIAGDQLQKLRVDAVNTTATFEQIGPALQAAIGPGVRAGLTLDQVRETTVKIVQAAGSLSIPMHQVNQEVRAILEGTINEDARLAKVLGISNEMVKSWKQQGTLAEELNRRLAAFNVAGAAAANTLEGLKSNLQEAFNVFATDSTDRALEALRQRMQRLLPQLFDFKNARLDAAFQPLSDLLDDVFVRGINIAGDFIDFVVSGVKSISRFVGENRERVTAVLDAAEQIVRTVGAIVGQVFRAAAGTLNWKSGLDAAHGTLLLVQAVLISLAPLINAATTALGYFLAALQASPTFQALALIARVAGAGPSGAGAGANQQDLDNELQRLRDKQAGSRPTVTAPPSAGGGGRKGGSRKGDRLAQLEEQLQDAAAGVDRARIERAFNLTRDFLERQTQLIERQLADRKTSVEQFYADQERIQREAIDAEIKKTNEQYLLEEERLRQRKELIDRDKDLSAPEKDKRKQVEQRQFEQAVVPLVERATILERERADLAARVAAERRKEVEALETLLRDLDEQLALETGDAEGAAAAARARIDAEFKDRLAQLAANTPGGADSEEYQRALQLVEVLKKKAEYQLLYNELRRQQQALEFAEEQIRNDVERGLISEKVGREQIVAAQLKHKEAVEATVEKMRGLAVTPEQILEVERAAEAIEDLGKVVDERWQRIAGDAKSIFTDFLIDLPRDFAEATRKMLLAFAQMVQRMIAEALAAQLVKKLLGDPGGGGGGGGGLLGSIIGAVGGIFGGIFGGGGGASATSILKRTPLLGFAGGGPVAGPGTATSDSILARLSRGEFVVRAASVRSVGADVLAYINEAGRLPGFATGGLVGDLPGVAPAGAGASFSVNVNQYFSANTPAEVRQAAAAVKRNAARGVGEGVRRGVAARRD